MAVEDSNIVWNTGYTIYWLSSIKREEKKEKAIDNYLTKDIGASLALLPPPSRIQGVCIWLYASLQAKPWQSQYLYILKA